ncbi:hypothetical protein BJ875DRAFT_375392 [Amylocarpus encephaloides]|uniref:MARVEL domain-containing protein n=1 Tax=Amylocarpus encephaloides TaxID=45428 RepID=A0A9P8C7C4_9HELO|nr:hypothetical protein BJ875DRAFT_375392 [Amylocarpus encephaloides]
MGKGSYVANGVFRVLALISASIVAGIIGHFLYLLGDAGGSANAKIVFTVSLAGISIFFSLVLLPPFRCVFWAAPLDLAIFIMWMTSFGLLENLSGGHPCNAYWRYNYWGYYWGGYYSTFPQSVASNSIVNSAGCSPWRTALAFIFLGGSCWLVNACIVRLAFLTSHPLAFVDANPRHQGLIALVSGKEEAKTESVPQNRSSV